MKVNLNKIKGLMRERGETQAELAEYLGCCKASVVNYLNGKTEMKAVDVFKIADKYKVPIADLVEKV